MRFGPYFALLNGEFEHKNGKIVTDAYLDPKGVPTGPGGRITNLDGSPIVEGQSWTESDALAMYAAGQSDFAEAIWNMIDKKVRPQLKQYQFDALGVLGWNIGLGALEDSSAMELVNKGRFEEAASKFLLWRRFTLEGGKKGPDGEPARGPDNTPLPKGWTWFKASRGIYRRSISAALLMVGKGWANAAAPSKIVLKSYPTEIRGEKRYHDVVSAQMDWKEILADAQNDPLPIIEGAVKVKDDFLFEEPINDMERLQHSSAKAAGAEETLEEFVAHRRGLVAPVGTKPLSINTKAAEDVPYGIDPKKGMKPKEDAERYRRAVKKEKGIEMKKMGQALTVTGGAVGAANALSSEVKTLFDHLGTVGLTILAIAFGLGILYWVFGAAREWWNERKEVQAEIDAVQGMY